jgi:uncharacterized cupin superfamily protein
VKSTRFNVTNAVLGPLDSGDRLEGGATTSYSVDWISDDQHEVRGVWEMTPGVLTNVDADEMFVVISGKATLEFADGRVWQVGPGDVGVLVAGDPVRGTVQETIRKAYTKQI